MPKISTWLMTIAIGAAALVASSGATEWRKSYTALDADDGHRLDRSPPLGVLRQHVFAPEAFGADASGQSDATVAIQNALNAASQVGGTVELCGRYLIDSGDIVQPTGVAAMGCYGNYPGASWEKRDYSHTQSTVIQNSNVTWRLGSNARLSRLTFERKGLLAPRGFRDLVNAATTNLQGIAITLGDSGKTPVGNDVVVEDMLILGYQEGIHIDRASRYHIVRVGIDADRCLYINGSYDIGTILDIECYPFTTYNTEWARATWNVSAVGEDSRGQVVLTVSNSTTHGAVLQSGDFVNVFGLQGLPGLNRRYKIDVGVAHGNQTLALINSVLNPIVRGHITQGSDVVVLNNVNGIGVGQFVTGTGIPAGTTLVSLNRRAHLAKLSHIAEVTVSDTMISFTSPSFKSGGFVRFSEVLRNGDGVTISNAQGVRFVAPFVLGHPVAFHAMSGAEGTQFIGAQTDFDVSVQDPDSVAYLEEGDHVFSTFVGGSLGSAHDAVVLNRGKTAFQGPTSFAGTTLSANASGYLVWAQSGRASFVGCPDPGSAGRIYVGDNMDSLILSGSDLQGKPEIEYEHTRDAARVMTAGSQISGTLVIDGGSRHDARIRAFGQDGSASSATVPGPGGGWSFGTEARGISLRVDNPEGVSTNVAVISGGAGGSNANPAKFGSSNGPVGLAGAGAYQTQIGTSTSPTVLQGAEALSPEAAPIVLTSSGQTIHLKSSSVFTYLSAKSELQSLSIEYPSSAVDRQIICVTSPVAIASLSAISRTAEFDDAVLSIPAHSTLCQRFYANLGIHGTWVHEQAR